MKIESNFIQKIILVATVLFSINGFAQNEKVITYQNQTGEEFILNSILNGTEYREEQVQSTCYRDVPYTENVCRYETRYRQECRTLPGHQECRTVYEPVCRYETRYREECTQVGGGRICRTIPGDIVCRRLPNGENRCEKIPPREVCEYDPGRRVCRQVPYQDRVCHNEMRNYCEWIPPRNVCEQIPYQERVCRDEVKYRQEAYACTKTIKVPYTVELKKNTANVSFNFTELNRVISPVVFVTKLSDEGNLSLNLKDPNANTAVFYSKEITNNEDGKINDIDAKYSFKMLNISETLKATRGTVSNIDLGKHHLSFDVDGAIDFGRINLKVKISKKDDVKFDKTLTSDQIELSHTNGQTHFHINLEKLGAPKLGGVFTTKHQIELILNFNYGEFGEMLLPNKNQLTLEHSAERKVE